MLRIAGIGACAWMAGLLAYESVLRLGWRQSMGQDWKTVVFWSALIIMILVPLVYQPSMSVIRKLLKGSRPFAWFPFVGILLACVPTSITVFAWGGRLHDLVSQEALTFAVLFAVFGLIFGTGFALTDSR